MNVSELLDAAETHLSRGRDAAAQKLFAEALEQPGGAARAVAGLGAIALRAGDADRARELFGRGLALAPENADLLVGLAAVHVATQHEEEAEICLRRAMRLDPESAVPPANLAMMMVSRRNLEGAHALARRAMELAPDSPDSLTTLANVEVLRGDHAAAHPLFEKAAALAPEKPETQVNLAVFLRMIGDVARAVEILERARLREPDAPFVLSRLAECKVALGEFETARNLVRQAVAVAPADGDVRNAEGWVLLHAGHYAQALESLRLAARYNPQDPAPMVNLAVLMRRNNQIESALAAVRRAVALGEQADDGARRLEIDLLCMAGQWREAWRRHDEMWRRGHASEDGAASPDDAGSPDEAGLSDDAVAEFGSRVALIVDDLSSSLMALRLIPRLAAPRRRVRLLCLPVYASFFRSVPGIDSVEARDAVVLARDVDAGETALLLDDLPRLMRATPACLAPLELTHDGPSPGAGDAPGGPAGTPKVGLWWEDGPGAPDPRALLGALPGVPGLLRAPDSDQPPVLSDGGAPEVLLDRDAEHLLEMAEVLLSLDLVVAVDGAAAHLAASLGCRTVVVCQTDVPWYWQPCGPDGVRWYPTARAVARDPGGEWSTLSEACDRLLAGAEAGDRPPAGAGARTAPAVDV